MPTPVDFREAFQRHPAFMWSAVGFGVIYVLWLKQQAKQTTRHHRRY